MMLWSVTGNCKQSSSKLKNLSFKESDGFNISERKISVFVLPRRACLKLFNIQITSRDIFIFHYFWYIPSHIHKLQFMSNKLRKMLKFTYHTEVKNKVYLFSQSSWKTNVIPTVVLPPSKWFFQYPLWWWTRINTPFVL